MDKEERVIMENLEIVRIWGELAQSSTREKYKTLSTVCSLAAMLLIIATFNENLFPITKYVKILVTILLSLIPLSLWGLLYALYQDEKVARTELEKITEEEMSHKGLMHFLLDIFPYLVAMIFTVVIFLIALLIWLKK